MSRTVVVRTIRAPLTRVFEAVAHIDQFSAIVPEITSVEFLTDRHEGVGARFRETRQMGKRVASTELEVTEYVASERVRMVADQGGTIWDTLFTTTAQGDGSVELRVEMEARAYKFIARLVNPLIRGMVQGAIERDMEAVKRHCES